MRIDSGRLQDHLRNGLKPLYVIHGDAPLLQIESCDAIRRKALESGYAERELLTAEQGFDWKSLIEASRSLSLFSRKKLIDFRIPSGKVGIEGGKILQAYCAELQPDVITMISLPKLDRQSLSSKWFEVLEKCGVAVSADTVARDELPGWIGQRLAIQKQQADMETLRFLAGQVEGNLLAAHQEIRKLGLLYPEGRIAFEDVKKAVLDVARYDLFQLGEAMLAGDVRRYAKILEGLQGEGMAESLVLWQICEEIRALFRVLDGMKKGKNQAQALRDAHVWGKRQSPVLKACGRASMEMLEGMLVKASGIDLIIKGLRKGDAWDELLQLGLNFAALGKNG